MKWLIARLPNRDRALGGIIHADGDIAQGVSVNLEDRVGGELGRQDIWLADFGSSPAALPGVDASAGSMYPLAYPTAVWAFWKMGPTDITAFGTTDWRSFALMGMGADAQKRGDEALAKLLYRRALVHDPGNRPARLALWMLELQAAYDL
jgi:hypothetical protein